VRLEQHRVTDPYLVGAGTQCLLTVHSYAGPTARPRASSFLASAHERALDAAALSASSPPPPLQLPADLIRLVACACRGPEALRWCAVCREHHACRPPLRFLIIDDYPAIEMHSGPARVALAFNRSRLPRPNADWVEAASCEASGRATESSLSGMSAVMACEGAGGNAVSVLCFVRAV